MSRTEPGLIISAAAHASLLAVTLIAFSSPAKFENAQESIPVEMITAQAFSQISKGEKTAKEVKPVQKADKVADVQETKPTPPIAEAKKDTPLPPPPLKRMPDPGQDDEPKKPEPQKVAALPPPRPPVEPVKTAPEPPKRPEPPKAEAKEPPEEAETVKPTPPVRPKAEAKPTPAPPKPPEKPRLAPDEVAKLLARSKTEDKTALDKPASKPKSGQESDEKKSSLDLNAISRLLDKDKPQAKGSTGKEVVRTASLGTATGNAPKMAPNIADAINSLIMEQYMKCWHYFGTGAIHKYVPHVRVQFRPDGALMGEPVLVNPTSDPAFASLASAAMGAARECNPLKIPAQFAPYYEQWKSRTIAFDPEEMR